MTFKNILDNHPLILTECAICERLRRYGDVELHPTLFNSPLIYDKAGRQRLEEIYLSYVSVAQAAKLPILLCAPTWRVDKKRVGQADVPVTINRDAVVFIKEIQARYNCEQTEIVAGALIAPAHECYSADSALARAQAADYHGWQIDNLVDAGAEVIIAQTMPAVSESLGMVDRLGDTNTPCIISFVINRFGMVLDGTPLFEAIDRIDQSTATPPIGYMVNCVYPTFVNPDNQPSSLVARLIGIQANASSKDHDELDGAQQLHQDPLPDWGKNMLHLHRQQGVTILGGCCGTDDSYLRYLVDALG